MGDLDASLLQPLCNGMAKEVHAIHLTTPPTTHREENPRLTIQTELSVVLRQKMEVEVSMHEEGAVIRHIWI